MAEKIRVELDNATGPGFDQIEQGAKGAANAVDKLGDEAQQTAIQVDKIGKAGDSLKSLQQLAKMVVSFQALRFAIQGVSSTIKTMADEGSPAFVKLKEATDDAYYSLLEIGNDPAVQGWAESLSSTIKENLVPALSSVPSFISKIHNSLADVMVLIAESGGFVPEGTLVDQGEAQVRQEKINVELKKTNAIIKERVNVDEKLAAIDKKLAAERESANLANIQDQGTLLALLSDETDALRELERSGSRDAKAKEERLKKIEEIRKQMAKASDAAIDADLKKQEEASKRRYDIEMKWQNAIAENKKLAIDNEQQAIKAQQDKANAIMDALEKAIAELKGAKGGNAIEEAKGGLDKRKVLKEVASNRGEKAAQEQAEIEAEAARKQAPGDDPKVIAQREAQANARIVAARKKAEASAYKDAARGKVGGEEVDQAQSELISGQVAAAQASGKLGGAAAAGLQQALQTQTEATQLALQQQSQIDEIKAALAAQGTQLKGAANRGRSARGGLGG